jgi:hypothetical protein
MYTNHLLNSEPDWLVKQATNILTAQRAIRTAKRAGLKELTTIQKQDGKVERTATVIRINKPKKKKIR